VKSVTAIAVFLLASCSVTTTASQPVPSPAISSSPVPADVPPPGSAFVATGCGKTHIYKGGILPDWALVNAPALPYVVADEGTAVGYLFTYPLGLGGKILWYVGPPRLGSALAAEGHPVGSSEPIARFSKSADSAPGEIYPTGPSVPFSGCWHFVLSWQGGAQRAEVDLSFS
jgi:hypothetical protein